MRGYHACIMTDEKHHPYEYLCTAESNTKGHDTIKSRLILQPRHLCGYYNCAQDVLLEPSGSNERRNASDKEAGAQGLRAAGHSDGAGARAGSLSVGRSQRMNGRETTKPCHDMRTYAVGRVAGSSARGRRHDDAAGGGGRLRGTRSRRARRGRALGRRLLGARRGLSRGNSGGLLGRRGRSRRGGGSGAGGSGAARLVRVGLEAAPLGRGGDALAIVLPDVLRNGTLHAAVEVAEPLAVLAVCVLLGPGLLDGVSCRLCVSMLAACVVGYMRLLEQSRTRDERKGTYRSSRGTCSFRLRRRLPGASGGARGQGRRSLALRRRRP